MSASRLVVIGFVCAAACKFPELPPVDENDDGGGSGSDGADGDANPDGPMGPNVMITSGPASGTSTGPRVRFEFTVRDGSPFCRFDSAQLIPCTSPVVTNLSAGAHTFYVQAQNSGGGIDSDARTWSIACQPRQATNDTFGLFRMDEGTGTTVANEHPASPPPPNNHIRFGDPPYDPTWTTTGRFGSALRFSAEAVNVTDRIYSNILDLGVAQGLGAHSIEMWVNPMPTFPHDLDLYVTSGGTQSGRMDYLLKFVRSGGQGSFQANVRWSGVTETITSPLVQLGGYHYVVLSYEPGSPVLLFVDGAAVRTSQSVTGAVEMFMFDALTKFEGDVDELHLTFHPYTESELLDFYCPPPP